MAALTTQHLVDAGTAPVLTGPAATSDTAEVGNGANRVAVYKNTDSVAHVVKVVVPGNTTYGQANPDPSFNVAAGAEVWIPLRKEYADAAVAGVGRCTIQVFAADGTTANATGVTVGVLGIG
jgi:hypothetical protein